MPPTMMSRLGFLDLPTNTEPRHANVLTRAREASTAYVNQLRGPAEDVTRDPGLNEVGKTNRLRAMLAETAKAVGAAFDAARREIDADHDKAARALQARLWLGVDDERRLDRTRAELLALVQRDPINARDLPFDPSTGAALLASGGKVLSLLDSLVRESDLSDARLLTLAIQRGGPILKALVGGAPVVSAMMAALSTRVIESDPEAARHHADLRAAERVLSTAHGDERLALEGAARVLGLPKEAAHAVGRPDPIRDAARKAS